MKHPSQETYLFKKLGLITILAVYFLILVGGIVRSTGSGMGCPDWPRCFGNWVPPTDVSQLPAEYKEIYKEKRILKNQKIAGYMETLGFRKLADEIRTEANIFLETDFNGTKTWIEYLNRLVGVVIGLLVFSTLVVSMKYLGKDNLVFILSCLSFLLVAFQGWIGSIVVSTNLLPWMVTVHMLLALVLIALLIFTVYRAFGAENNFEVKFPKRRINILLILCLITGMSQVVIGTQVREAIDQIAMHFNYTNRSLWIENLGLEFYIHRSYSILIFILHISVVYILYSSGKSGNYLLNLSKILLALVVVEIISGVAMAYFAIPAFIQPIHLLIATLIFGFQFYILLIINYSPSKKTEYREALSKFKLVKA